MLQMKYTCLVEIIFAAFVVYHSKIVQKHSVPSAMESKGTLQEIQDAVNVGTGRIIASKNPGKILDTQFYHSVSSWFLNSS